MSYNFNFENCPFNQQHRILHMSKSYMVCKDHANTVIHDLLKRENLKIVQQAVNHQSHLSGFRGRVSLQRESIEKQYLISEQKKEPTKVHTYTHRVKRKIAIPVNWDAYFKDYDISKQSETSELDERDLRELKRILSSLDLNNPTFVLDYGESTQKNLAGLANKLTNQNSLELIDKVKQQLNDLLTTLSSLKTSDLELHKADQSFISKTWKKKIVPFLTDPLGMSTPKTKKESMAIFSKRFKAVAELVNESCINLERNQYDLKQRIDVCVHLSEENLNHLKELDLLIIAGKIFLEKAKEHLKSLEEKPTGTIDEANLVSSLKYSINRFEKKIQDLKLARLSAMQSIPQLKWMESNVQGLAERIQSAVLTMVPSWKKGFVTAIQMKNSKDSEMLDDSLIEAIETHQHFISGVKSTLE